MIKANKKPVIVAHATIEPDFARSYAQRFGTSYATFKERLDDVQLNIQSYKQTIEEYQERIREEEEIKATSERELAKIDLTQAEQEAAALGGKVARIPFVARVYATGHHIVIQTRLMFVPIRLNDGSRIKHRTCIGSFKISTDLRRANAIRIEQELFKYSQYDHWSIKHHAPCWGDWEEQIQETLDKKDILGLLTVLQSYFTSTNDGGAWRHSHAWKADCRHYKDPSTGVALQSGDYIMCTHTHTVEGALIKKGHKAKIHTRSGMGMMSGLWWKNLVKDSNGNTIGHDQYGGKDGHSWNMNIIEPYYVKITEAEFLSRSTSFSGEQPKNVLELLDALPDGSTLEDALKIVNS